MNGPFRVRGATLPTVLGVSLVLLSGVVALHLWRVENAGRLRQQVVELRARWLARSALARARHEVERRPELTGTVAADVLSEMTCSAVPFDEGHSVGVYRVVAVTVRREGAGRRVIVKGEGVVESRPKGGNEPVRVEEEVEIDIK